MIAPLKLLTLAALLAYAVAVPLAALTLQDRPRKLTRMLVLALWLGLACNVAVLVLRRQSHYEPAAMAFDAFAIAAFALAGLTALLHAARAATVAKFLLMHLAAVWICLWMALLTVTYPSLSTHVWDAGHVCLAIAGTAVLTTTACAGALYLYVHRRMRRKDPEIMASRWPSLERLDRFMRRMLPIGFALLTAAIAAGLLDALHARHGQWFVNWWTHPKTLTAAVAWLVYGGALYASFARRFRGRQAAVLCVSGFVLLVLVVAASTLMPKM